VTDHDGIHVRGLSPGDVALLRDVAEAAAEKAVKSTFVALGLDPDDPINAQKNFVFLRNLAAAGEDPEAQADAQWLRRTRKRAEGIVGKAFTTAVGVTVLHVIYLNVSGLKSALNVPSGQ
jgi:hypothetical protein